ncbi:hypothetical protein [Cohnella sp. 56]|uniref:hypothetical protein n=1 Tax=Cohnella sp. 56 TaxID=3113722 RepID=UPI0030EA3F8E
MKVWVVRYALSAGIKECEGEVSNTSNDMVVVNRNQFYHGKNRDWFDNEADAIKAAEAMRQKKIESLRKQIAKLEKLSFEGGKTL